MGRLNTSIGTTPLLLALWNFFLAPFEACPGPPPPSRRSCVRPLLLSLRPRLNRCRPASDKLECERDHRVQSVIRIQRCYLGFQPLNSSQSVFAQHLFIARNSARCISAHSSGTMALVLIMK